MVLSVVLGLCSHPASLLTATYPSCTAHCSTGQTLMRPGGGIEVDLTSSLACEVVSRHAGQPHAQDQLAAAPCFPGHSASICMLLGERDGTQRLLDDPRLQVLHPHRRGLACGEDDGRVLPAASARRGHIVQGGVLV